MLFYKNVGGEIRARQPLQAVISRKATPTLRPEREGEESIDETMRASEANRVIVEKCEKPIVLEAILSRPVWRLASWYRIETTR